MKQVRGNPTSNMNISPSTYAITATGPSGTLTVSGDISEMTTGQSFILQIDGGTSGGFTDGQEYFCIEDTSGSIRIADSKEDAFDGSFISGASGDAGTGNIFPSYSVGGILVTNTAGNIYIRGIQNKVRGFGSFSLQTTVSNGSLIPFMIGDFTTSGLTASGLVAWMD
jgi:hypothetical protein